MTLIYHIVERSLWQQAEQAGTYRAESLKDEGFIHCSTVSQIVWVANTFYRGQTNLVLLGVDPAKVQPPLRYDPVETGEAFPHIYGPLNLDAVVQVLEFAPEPDGTFQLPTQIMPSA